MIDYVDVSHSAALSRICPSATPHHPEASPCAGRPARKTAGPSSSLQSHSIQDVTKQSE
jgi:hypothetical protein